MNGALRRTAVFLVLFAWALVAQTTEARGRSPSRSKKQKTIDRLLFTAEYYLLRERDVEAAAAEYRAVLRLDRGHVRAGLALAAIEIERQRAREAVKVLGALAKRTRKEGEVWR